LDLEYIYEFVFLVKRENFGVSFSVFKKKIKHKKTKK